MAKISCEHLIRMVALQSAFYSHPFPPFGSNCNSYIKGCSLASRDYLPPVWRVQELRKMSESAQCSVSMRESFVCFWEENSYPFLLFYNLSLSVYVCIDYVGPGYTFQADLFLCMEKNVVELLQIV